MTRCWFHHNHAAHGGGGMRVNLGGAAGVSSQLEIRESEFTDNSAVVEGGAFDLIMAGGKNEEVRIPKHAPQPH